MNSRDSIKIEHTFLTFRQEKSWFSLQHFAVPEDEGRTEDPTESKFRKARREGRVAKSQELAPSIILISTLFLIFMTGPSFVKIVMEMMKTFFNKISLLPLSSVSEVSNGKDFIIFFKYYYRLVLPILVIIFFVAILVMAVQVKFVFTWKPLIPNFKKIIPNFAQYFSKTLFSLEMLYNLGKSLLKVTLVILIAYFTIFIQLRKFLTASLVPLVESGPFLFRQVFIIMILSALIFCVLAVADLFVQKLKYKRQLKMTKQEVREEIKEDEGSPFLKSRIKSRMLDFLKATMMRDVTKADVIITNPTHISVALQYKQGSRAPKMLAKGQNRLALRIRELAQNERIPIIENKPLARALYSNLEIGQEIPPEYWEIVSTIFAQVYRMTGKSVQT